MKSVPLTRVRHANNFAIALEEKGAPIDQLLNRSHLPAELLHGIGDDGVISAISMLDFAENAAHHTGILDLGFWAGTIPVESYGEFGKHVIKAPTLYSAIMTFCREVRSECSAADYYLKYDGSRAWFCHGPVADSPVQQSQHELYALMIIIQVIQLALGANWHPARIRLQAQDDSGAKMNPYLLKADIQFGAPITAIEFPLKSLATPLRQQAKDNYTFTPQGARQPAIHFPNDPLIALKELMTLYIKQSKQPSVELAAELVGVSKRSLQRYLNSKDTSYSNLLGETKYNIALPLLSDTSNSITEIAYELGYANVAHFSRAFKRITGMSPKSYRNLLNT